VTAGRDCVLADGEEAFADALASLLQQGAPEIGACGRELATERYSIQALTRLLAE
jgi:hypothetical protein